MFSIFIAKWQQPCIPIVLVALRFLASVHRANLFWLAQQHMEDKHAVSNEHNPNTCSRSTCADVALFCQWKKWTPPAHSHVKKRLEAAILLLYALSQVEKEEWNFQWRPNVFRQDVRCQEWVYANMVWQGSASNACSVSKFETNAAVYLTSDDFTNANFGMRGRLRHKSLLQSKHIHTGCTGFQRQQVCNLPIAAQPLHAFPPSHGGCVTTMP